MHEQSITVVITLTRELLATVRLYRLVLGPPTDLARRRNDTSPLSAKAVR